MMGSALGRFSGDIHILEIHWCNFLYAKAWTVDAHRQLRLATVDGELLVVIRAAILAIDPIEGKS